MNLVAQFFLSLFLFPYFLCFIIFLERAITLIFYFSSFFQILITVYYIILFAVCSVSHFLLSCNYVFHSSSGNPRRSWRCRSDDCDRSAYLGLGWFGSCRSNSDLHDSISRTGWRFGHRERNDWYSWHRVQDNWSIRFHHLPVPSGGRQWRWSWPA